MGAGLSREAGIALPGTGCAGVRGASPLPQGSRTLIGFLSKVTHDYSNRPTAGLTPGRASALAAQAGAGT
ncbi:hypothetical protein B8W72_28655 [Pseudomonas putida]|uniref:Uncharacterized protein n=1 Tax=Pseudomonas putida TaxID=303 RepID=A0A1Y3KDE2_PSEPU|nr:hypothetical protein B8W72_28655 [Pseudomonas putida]